MKTTKSIGLFLLSIFCCINFTSCDPANNEGDDLIWDFSPIVLYISVQDTQGNDLLNPLTKGSIANQGIKAIYKGETYEKDAPLKERTRAYMAYFAGLQTEINRDGKYYLTFGEFNGDQTFDNEKVEIDWNDGKEKSVITFSSKLTWKSKKEPIFNRKFCLNGEEISLKEGFVITKSSSQSEQKFDILSVEYGIEAETDEIKEKIKADLESKSPYTKGEAYNIAIQEKNSGKYTLFNSEGLPIADKEFVIKETEAHGVYGITAEIAKAFRLIPPEDQIYSHIKLKLDINGEKSSNTFNIFTTRPNIFWIYEDLTEYYKDKYPDGKVKEVVRLLKSKPNYPTKQ